MSSLVLELQAAALDPAARVSDVLRKALVVAEKLGLADFSQFIEKELSGYLDDDIPAYRRTTCVVVARCKGYGEIPTMFSDVDLATELSTLNNRRPIAEIESLAEHSGELEAPFSPERLAVLRKINPSDFDMGWIPTRKVPMTAVKRILDSVRNTILRWALRLEKDGILGEGPTFSDKEKREASGHTYIVQTFMAPVGHVAGRDVTDPEEGHNL